MKYILKGADVMRPGIVKYDEWGEKDALVVVRDEKKGRGLAVGRALRPERGDGGHDQGHLPSRTCTTPGTGSGSPTR